MVQHTKYLIIGNSAAGIGAVEGIRSVDSLGQILLISDEPHHTYSRPLISYWIEGKVEPERMLYRPQDFYLQQGVQTKLGDKVLEINPSAKTVRLDNGETIAYDKLLLATGSHPFVPPIKGKETAKNTTTFTKKEDAQKIFTILEECSKENRLPKVVILGAGLIGLKAAEALADKSESITVLDLAERIMPSVFDENASEVMKKHLLDQGIHLKLGTSIEEIGDLQVTLTNGEVLDYDILVLAVGTRPASELAEEAGLTVERGILTNSYQQTSEPDIYAAGDCTISHDISSGMDKNMAILPNAYLQGEVAGKNMAGRKEIIEELFPLNSMGLLGLYMLTAGNYDGETIIVENPESYKEFFVKDNKLSGYIIIGTCQRGGIYTDLIRNQTDLSDIDLESLFVEPGMMPFSYEVRKKNLAQPH